MNTKLANLFQYIALLLQKYNELQASQNVHPFRILSIKNTEENLTVMFQVVGKATFLEVNANEILSDDAFTNRFSGSDIRQLTKAYQKKESAKNKELVSIKGKKFDSGLKKIIVNFEDSKGNQYIKSAAEIVTDNKMIQLLSSKDAISIGYLAGYEHSTAHNIVKEDTEL